MVVANMKRPTKSENAESDAMLFEHTLRLFYGEKAHQTAGQANHPKYRGDWLVKILRTILKRIDKIETSPRHKKSLLGTAENASNAIGNEPTWQLVYRLLALIGKLLGYGSQKGALVHSVCYWQNEEQYFTEDILTGGSGSRLHEDKDDALSVRQEIVHFLKKKGHSNFKIALVLQTSEYEVQRLQREL